jgi:predicted transposase/invertase (TIGR01784 family)
MEKEKEVRYLNLLTDFGFKRTLAQEESKSLLIHLLNAILEDKEKIVSIRYLQTEQLGRKKKERKAIYDIYCENDRSERLIIEMQIGKQRQFMDRSLYYSTFPIQAQAKKGKWDYKLKPVYHIGILDFIHDSSNDNYENRYCVMNEKEHTRISDNWFIITIELPKFNKKLEELKTELEKWVYCFRNMANLKERPEEIKGPVFDRLFEMIDINNLTTDEMEGYKKSVAEYADVQLMMACSREDGREEGIQRGRKESMVKIAGNLLKMNFSIADIAKATGLTPKQIKQL